MLDQIQLLQQHVTARIGWRFIDGVAAIVRANWLFPAAPTFGKIGFRQQTPLLFAEPDQATGNFSTIESVPPTIDYALESASEISLIENFSGPQRPPVMAKNRLRGRELTDVRIRGNRFGQHMARWKAVGCQIHRRTENRAERKRAISLVGGKPTVQQRRHQDR